MEHLNTLPLRFLVKKNTTLDIWALSFLLYEIVHGDSPFSSNQHDEDEYKDIFRNILKKDYVIDDKLNISNEYIELIHKLLQENNDERIYIF
jgi:serine/threonine protein kinase